MNLNWIQEFIHSGAILGLPYRGSEDRFLLAWGEWQWLAAPEPGKAAFYAPDFFLRTERPWFQPAAWRIVDRNTLHQALGSLESAPLTPPWVRATETTFKASFLALQELIAQGTLKKGVPVIFDSAAIELRAAHVAGALSRLLEQTRSLPLSIYGFWRAGQGLLGASPELLFRHEAAGPGATSSPGRVHTTALAGTRRKEDQAALPLLEDPKERAEHQWVIDGIQESLAPFGRTDVGMTRVVDLATLSHLLTPVELTLSRPFSFDEIVKALHPTPALGAFPREAGLHWLRTEDAQVGRAHFGAPFGAIWPEKEDGKSREAALCLVAIRNLQWQGSIIRLGAGCGVVAESCLEREWRELQGKLAAIRQLTGIGCKS